MDGVMASGFAEKIATIKATTGVFRPVSLVSTSTCLLGFPHMLNVLKSAPKTDFEPPSPYFDVIERERDT
jgi:hypothetical protein